MSTDLDIMLIGKTGVGKSRSGNSLLDRAAFRSVATTDSATMRSQRELTVLDDGRKLCVVDTPGVGDTRLTDEKGQQLFMSAVREAVLYNPAGYHALIIVLRFGARFTHEDAKTIRYLKTAFGQDFIRKHCILLMTHGDNFQAARADGEITVPFLEWCRVQAGEFQNLLAEVEERIVLFNNSGTKEEKLHQRGELVAMVDHLMARGGGRYTDANFEEARRHREKLVRDRKISQLAVDTQQELSLILYEKEKVASGNEDISVKIFILGGLKGRVSDLQNRLSHEASNTPDLESLKSVLSRAQSQIDKELSSLEMSKDLAEKEKQETGVVEETLQLKAELEKQQRENSKLNAELNKEYLQARDANNESWASKIWNTVVSIASNTEVQNFVSNVIIPKVVGYFIKK